MQLPKNIWPVAQTKTGFSITAVQAGMINHPLPDVSKAPTPMWSNRNIRRQARTAGR